MKDANCFCNQGVQLREDRMSAVCLEVDLMAGVGPVDQSYVGKGFQLPLNGADTGANLSGNLTHIERLAGMAIE
jgi:hypothetical protein